MTLVFKDLVNRIAHAKIKKIAPPFLSYEEYDGDIISFLSSFYGEYDGIIHSICKKDIECLNNEMAAIIFEKKGIRVPFDLLRDIDAVQKMIIDVLVQYFKGYDILAFELMEKSMTNNKCYLLQLLPQLTLSKNTCYYRVRQESNKVLNDRKDLFHVPFEERFKCGYYRYSMLGYPSLYLSKKLEVSLLETNVKSNDSYYASCFKSKQDLCFVDLALGNEFNNLWEQYSLLVFYPLIAACGLRKKHKEAPFHPEYIIPQILTQIIRSHNCSDNINGISYISTRKENPDFTCFDQRNFVLWISGADQERGYSDALANLFKMTLPQLFTGTENPDDKEFLMLFGGVFSDII